MRLFAILAAVLYFTSAHASSAFVETQLSAPGPRGALRGIMLSPKKAEGPAVLIIPGSGPTDRDGNNPLGIKAATYRMLAEGLAEKGITTVRVDKRGMFTSRDAVPDANAVTIKDYTVDVHNWITVIRKLTGQSCVWVAGHSEGGLVAMAASRNAGDICGLILLAAPGRPAGEILREQLEANLPHGPVLDQALRALTKLEAGRQADVRNMTPELLTVFRPEVQGYLISLLAVDPATLISGFQKPVLIVQGTKDLQVSLIDASRLQASAPNAKLLLLTDANHVLKAVQSSDPEANMASYLKPKLPLASGTADGIAEFVLAARVSN